MPKTSVSATLGPGNNVGSELKQHAPLRAVDRRGAVRAFHQPGIERNALRGRIEEQFHRVVARLAVDVHRPGERGGAVVREPPVVRLPTPRRRDQDHLAAAGVFQGVAAALGADQHLGNARLAAEQVGDSGGQLRRRQAPCRAPSASADLSACTKTWENW